MRFSRIRRLLHLLNPTGATVGGQPVNATAVFTPVGGLVNVTILNNQANPTSIVQAISDLSFNLSNVTSGFLVRPQALTLNAISLTMELSLTAVW